VTTGDGSWVEAVLGFWFGELDRKAWFTKTDATDSLIRDRFLAVHEWIAQHEPPEARAEPRAVLAAVIALDQFPRNMFRGSPRAFATDPSALAIAKEAVAKGFDLDHDKDGRLFLYLPFEHSEDVADQRRAVELFALLNDPEVTRYAQAHKDIIDRFGRFPHRNAVLGRMSTPQEIEFLKQPGSSF
jgi:uncharacterized protein (DUF924 family)